MEDIVKPVCLYCKHLSKDGTETCNAFPNGIPKVILKGQNDHIKPLHNQENNIVFEHLSEENAQL